MNDRDIATLFTTQLLPVIRALPDFSGIDIKRAYQSSQHGPGNGPIVYFHKLFDHRYGAPGRFEIWDGDAGEFRHEETQQYESIYQFMVWTRIGSTGLTESDILNAVAGVIQSDSILRSFRSAGVGIQRVTQVRNEYITDDRDQFKATPSFDVTLSYRRTLTSTLPGAVTSEFNIIRV